jgi:hypothetical protein
MDESAFALLASDIAAHCEEVEAVFELIEERVSLPGQTGLESLGYQLHNLYSACEELFETVAGAFENHIDVNGGYHIELLKRMRMPIEGVRSRVISDESYRLLDSLRSFRHVFRHAYGVPLDPRKINILVEDARTLRQIFRREIDGFMASVKPD